MNENRAEEIKSKTSIYDILSKYGLMPNRANMIVCPFHSDNDASLKIYNNNTYHCFGCGADGDVIDFVQGMEKCDFVRALEIISGEDFSVYAKPKPQQKKNYVFDKKKLTKYIIDCHKNANKTNYFTKRCLNKDTIAKFRLGFDEKYGSVVIPYDNSLTYYQSRNISTKKFYKPKTEIAGKEPLFNKDVLLGADVVFVVESPICAMSITQCGFNAIATCGTQGWKKVPGAPTKEDCIYVLCFDNDVEGAKAQYSLIKEIPGKFYLYNVADECKDPNELLMKDAERLKHNCEKAFDFIKENASYYENNKN